MNRWLVFFLLGLTSNLMAGLIGVYTMIKHPISETFGVKQDFLGFLDSLSFLGRVIGSIYLIFYPPEKPRRIYTISGLIQGISASFIIMASFFPLIDKFLLGMSMFVFGLSRSSVMMIPLLIVSQYFDRKKQKITINLWMASTHLADVAALYFMNWFMESLQIRWDIAFATWIVFFIISVLLVQFSIAQIKMPQQKNLQQNKSITYHIGQSYNVIKKLCKKKSYIFTMLDIVFQQSIMFSYMLWLPYYFEQIGFKYESIRISSLYPIFALVGSIIMQLIIKKFKKYGSLISSIFIFMHCLVIYETLKLHENKSQINSYKILIAMAGFFIGGPVSRLTGTQIFQHVSDNKERLIVLNSYKILRIFFSVFVTYITGVLLKQDLNWLFYIIFLNSVIILIVHCARRFLNLYERKLIRFSNEQFSYDSLQNGKNIPDFQQTDKFNSQQDDENIRNAHTEESEEFMIKPIIIPMNEKFCKNKYTLFIIIGLCLTPFFYNTNIIFSKYYPLTIQTSKLNEQVQPTFNLRNFEPHLDFLSKSIFNEFWDVDQNLSQSTQRLLPGSNQQSDPCLSEQLTQIKFMRKQGLFASSFKLNYMDEENSDYAANIRTKLLQVDDINMFSTSLTWLALIEASELNVISINETKLLKSLNTLNMFRDKNTKQGTPQYTFWLQQKVEDQKWRVHGKHLQSLSKIDTKECQILNKFYKISEKISDFFIPADNDDSSVNIALLSMLKQSNSSLFEKWYNQNTNIQLFYQNSLKYSYQPLEKSSTLNPQSDIIVPKTFYVLKDFLQQKKKNAQSLILPTTWLINNVQSKKEVVQMHHKANNIEGVVCANFLWGASYAIAQGLFKPSQKLQNMMRDTVDLLSYIVEKAINKRQDLILGYYPNEFVFYYYVARLYKLLKKYDQNSKLLTELRVKLQSGVKNRVTQNILKSLKMDENKNIFWSTFLGNFKGKQRNQDSLASTSLALNALLDFWTINDFSQMKLQKNSFQIKQVIQKGIQFLIKNINRQQIMQNAFFIGFGDTGVFPSNYDLNQQNQIVDPHIQTKKHISAVKGIIDEKEYQEMLQKNWYGKKVEPNFQGFNKVGMNFPYWSSKPLTKAYMLLAIGKFNILKE